MKVLLFMFLALPLWTNAHQTPDNSAIEVVSAHEFSRNMGALIEQMQQCKSLIEHLNNDSAVEIKAAKRCVNKAVIDLQPLKPQLRYVRAQLDFYDDKELSIVLKTLRDTKKHMNFLRQWHKDN